MQKASMTTAWGEGERTVVQELIAQHQLISAFLIMGAPNPGTLSFTAQSLLSQVSGWGGLTPVILATQEAEMGRITV
jgi:hypothetical protein